MKATLIRVGMVFLAVLVGTEVLLRLGVHWKESTSELWEIFSIMVMTAGIVWATGPLFAKAIIRSCALRVFCRVGVVVVLFVGFWVALFYYSMSIRTNLGWYEEPKWVEQFPEFQKQWRAKVESYKW
ncbi:MAG: hypothetical protein AAF591_06235 [Verrucomicrobiota bacterium]